MNWNCERYVWIKREYEWFEYAEEKNYFIIKMNDLLTNNILYIQVKTRWWWWWWRGRERRLRKINWWIHIKRGRGAKRREKERENNFRDTLDVKLNCFKEEMKYLWFRYIDIDR